jgi:hypothetical protein
MRIRQYTPADLDALRRLHAAQGFGYPFPDLESPLFVSKLVLEEDGDEVDGGFANAETPAEMSNAAGREVASVNSPPGNDGRDSTARRSMARSAQPTGARPPRIEMAALLRLTAEAYLLHDASVGTPRQRWQNLLALHEAARQDAAARGLDDIQAFLPPRIARAFGRRLARLGWRQDPWPCFSRVTGDQ